MCDEYARRDARVRVLHKEDGGVSSARNAGLRASEGEYVVFLDSDDALRPGALQAALDAQAADPGAFVLWRYTDDAGDPAAAGPEAAAAPQSALARLYLDCLIAMRGTSSTAATWRGGCSSTSRSRWAKTCSLCWITSPCSGANSPGFHYAAVQSPLTLLRLQPRRRHAFDALPPRGLRNLAAALCQAQRAAQAAGAPAEDLLPLYRAELRVFAEGAADILRRDPAAPAQRRRKAAAALRCPWLPRAAGPNARRALLQPLLLAAALALPAAFVPPGRSRPHRQPAFRQAGLGRVLPAGQTLEAGGVGKLPETSLL